MHCMVFLGIPRSEGKGRGVALRGRLVVEAFIVQSVE